MEQTPLISNEDTVVNYESVNAVDDTKKAPTKQTPLPKLQLFTLLYIAFCEPVAATVVYPFVVRLVSDTGITGGNQAKTGYYAGIIESAFFAAEASTALLWGRISDRNGRKLPLAFGMLGLAAAITSFGLSSKFWPLVVSRCIQGVFNGNIGITKSAVVEITDSTNMATAFSFVPLSWGIGFTIGPLIGGVLAHPAERWPSTLGKISFLRNYPYALPCMCAALVPLSAFFLTTLFFKETLPSAISNKKKQAANLDPTLSADNDVEPPESTDTQPPPPLRSLMTRRIITALVNYAFLAWTEQACGVLVPLMYPTPIAYGGLGLSTFAIGVIMSSLGILIGVVSIVFFPRLMRHYSAAQIYRASYSVYLIDVLLLPLMNRLARIDGRLNGFVWAIIALQVVCATIPIMSFSAMLVILSEVAPSKSSLGAINGIAQTVACVMRVAAPFTSSSLFSLSQQRNIMGGTMVYWILELVILMGVVVSFRLDSPKRG